MTLKIGFGKCFFLFYQPMDEKIKTWTLSFPTKENPNMEKTLFNWPIVLQYDIQVKYQLISRKFLGMKCFSPERSHNQPKAMRICIRSINQSNRRAISVHFLFLFCFLFCFKVIRNPSNNTKVSVNWLTIPLLRLLIIRYGNAWVTSSSLPSNSLRNLQQIQFLAQLCIDARDRFALHRAVIKSWWLGISLSYYEHCPSLLS